jgi:magnesium-protoporphyrin IX monomethyl ester (oxidative) cyclase
MTDIAAAPVLNESTARARQSTVLTPNFYTTDYAAMDRIDISAVEIDRDRDFRAEVAALPDDLREEFLDFLVSSCTAEYSGCILYAEIMKRAKNPRMRELFGLMSRDESRHANFINQALRDFDLAVDLKLLRDVKKYKYFSPCICRKRSDMLVTSRSTGNSRETRSSGSIQSFFGSSSGATTSSAMARRSH